VNLYVSAPPRPSQTVGALVIANARFWPTVYPRLSREITSWETSANAIATPVLRSLAIEKLHSEAFNAEVAATLATLAPSRLRPGVIRSIVALEVLFDYLDGRTEALRDPLLEGPPLYAPFVDAVAATASYGATPTDVAAPPADAAYLRALSGAARDSFNALPGSGEVRPVASAAASRCSEAQTRLHAVPMLGVSQLREWASSRCADTGLDWREYTAGCASSVLAAHALIVLASALYASEADARRLDAAYLAIGAVITLLDSVVDRDHDLAVGRPGFVSFYEASELPAVLGSLVRFALSRAAEAPSSAHHAMTLAGVVAYYTTHPGASSPFARPAVHAARDALFPTILPTLAVMRSWRTAKLLRSLAPERLTRLKQGVK
jgi:tetraprenyl-beta-curcumene synthase